MPEKPKLAIYWAASCGGCEIAVVNLHEKLLDVDAALDFMFCPCLLDTKKKDIEALPDRCHCRDPLQRCAPHRGKCRDGPPAAEEIPAAGGLRLLRQGGVHPGSGQFHHQRRTALLHLP